MLLMKSSSIKEMFFMQGEILAPKNQQQKPYDLIGSVSTLLSFSSLLTFV